MARSDRQRLLKIVKVADPRAREVVLQVRLEQGESEKSVPVADRQVDRSIFTTTKRASGSLPPGYAYACEESPSLGLARLLSGGTEGRRTRRSPQCWSAYRCAAFQIRRLTIAGCAFLTPWSSPA
jgi:hypothetical protein